MKCKRTGLAVAHPLLHGLVMQTIRPEELGSITGGNEAMNALMGGGGPSPSSSPSQSPSSGLGSINPRDIQPADNRAFTQPDNRFQSPDMRVTSPQTMPWGQINDMFKQMGM